MKLNMDDKIKDLDDKPIVSENGPLVVGKMIANALMTGVEGEKIDGEEKLKRYELAGRINKCGEIEVNAEEASLIKLMVGGMATIVAGQILKMLKEQGA